MTYKEIQKILHNLLSKKSRLKSLQAYIVEAQELISGLTAVQYDKAIVVSSPGNSTEERYVKYLDRLKNLQERFDVLFDEMCAEEDLIGELMQNLAPEENEVILNRFMRGLSIKKTAHIMGYTIDGLNDVQSRAIEKMSKN